MPGGDWPAQCSCSLGPCRAGHPVSEAPCSRQLSSEAQRHSPRGCSWAGDSWRKGVKGRRLRSRSLGAVSQKAEETSCPQTEMSRLTSVEEVTRQSSAFSEGSRRTHKCPGAGEKTGDPRPIFKGGAAHAPNPQNFHPSSSLINRIPAWEPLDLSIYWDRQTLGRSRSPHLGGMSHLLGKCDSDLTISGDAAMEEREEASLAGEGRAPGAKGNPPGTGHCPPIPPVSSVSAEVTAQRREQRGTEDVP